MKASELVGKNAIRTKCTAYGDYSYTDNPIHILKVTTDHILYTYLGNEAKIFGDEVNILNNRWVDDCWTDYDELISGTKI